MNSDQINQRIAEIIGEGDLHFVCKRGYFYRPNGCGYTGSQAEAWRLTFEEAKKHEYLVDRVEPVTIHKCPPRDFCGSLDAMRVAEDWMLATSDSVDPGSALYRYAFHLYNNCVPDGQQPILATAAQRAEAFLRAFGKWEVSP